MSDIQKIFDSLLEDAVSNRAKLYRNGLEEKEKQSAVNQIMRTQRTTTNTGIITMDDSPFGK